VSFVIAPGRVAEVALVLVPRRAELDLGADPFVRLRVWRLLELLVRPLLELFERLPLDLDALAGRLRLLPELFRLVAGLADCAM